MYLRIRRRRSGVQKIEITSLVRLRDMAHEERAVAARVSRLGLLPCRTPPRELGIAHLELELARADIELDQIAIFDKRERSADIRLRRHVQHARAIRCAAHA